MTLEQGIGIELLWAAVEVCGGGSHDGRDGDWFFEFADGAAAGRFLTLMEDCEGAVGRRWVFETVEPGVNTFHLPPSYRVRIPGKDMWDLYYHLRKKNAKRNLQAAEGKPESTYGRMKWMSERGPYRGRDFLTNPDNWARPDSEWYAEERQATATSK